MDFAIPEHLAPTLARVEQLLTERIIPAEREVLERGFVASGELLDQLRGRLLEPPACHPWCAALPRMRLEVDATTLRARLQLDVGAATAVPLPGQAQHWLPRTVIVDGQPAEALMQGADGSLCLRLAAGAHEVLIEGPLLIHQPKLLLLDEPTAGVDPKARREFWEQDP